jgi:hypothetical protein
MAELRQRQPRVREPKYLAWLRKQSCACGCGAPAPSDAAHLRSGSLKYGKLAAGMTEKPSDCWAMPLNRACHMRQHAYGSEIEWWAAHGIPDPFARSMRYYAAYFSEASGKLGRATSASGKKRQPRARAEPRATQRPRIQSRGFPKGGPKRKISSRGFR